MAPRDVLRDLVQVMDCISLTKEGELLYTTWTETAPSSHSFATKNSQHLYEPHARCFLQVPKLCKFVSKQPREKVTRSCRCT